MGIKFKYFGNIAEKLDKTEELLEVPESTTNIRTYLVELYPELSVMTFSIAVNQELRDTFPDLKNIHEIAVLPPFAGG